MKDVTLAAADGHPLSALYGTPVEPSTKTLVLSSATGIRKEFYLGFARFLVQHGYNVLLYDYRGIGGSAPADLRTLDCAMHDWGLFDMNAALDYLVEQKGHSGIVWLGHSVGAQLVPLLKHQQHLKKVVAVNAALGYWGYFPFPKNLLVWGLWHLVYPLLIRRYGYGNMKKIGWGENLPLGVLNEWRAWCVQKDFFLPYLQASGHKEAFDRFAVPLTAVYTNDDYIANDKTVPLLLQFFPSAPRQLKKLIVERYTTLKAGHAGLFRKGFQNSLWPLLVELIEGDDEDRQPAGINCHRKAVL